MKPIDLWTNRAVPQQITQISGSTSSSSSSSHPTEEEGEGAEHLQQGQEHETDCYRFCWDTVRLTSDPTWLLEVWRCYRDEERGGGAVLAY